MHYTSIENIHKVIDPLFLDDIKEEYRTICESKQPNVKRQKLMDFQTKLGKLNFLDPACGSGNFLTETYLSLRRIENEVIKNIIELDKSVQDNQIALGELGSANSIIKVNLSQFYGIEINDFAVAVSKAALWIAESQMLRETEAIVYHNINFLPLKSYVNIIEGNALRVDWKDVIDPSECTYIMGNPPFVGYSLQSSTQKKDILSVYVDENNKVYPTAGEIDYVAGWFFKASNYMSGSGVRAALVATNSISQGEQVAYIWKPIFQRFGTHIDFAHRTFRWDSEASIKASVHCVIIGFSTCAQKNSPRLFIGNEIQRVSNINAYLIDGPDVLIESRTNPLCKVPKMTNGNKPVDGGFLVLSEEEKDMLIKKDPSSESLIRKYIGSVEYINNKPRYVLWLQGVSPSEIRKHPDIVERIANVKTFREASTKEATKKSAETPTLFQQIRQPNTNYIVVPRVSSENRRYVPIGFLSPDIIVSDSVQYIPDASLYDFGVVTSSVHMAWMRVVCGRLKSDYRYSAKVVYNNFPWPSPTDDQKAKIEQTAQEIIDARALYPDSSLADLYDPLTMPPELRKAHEANNKTVLDAYNFPRDITEPEIVAELMKMYQKLTEEK